MRTARRGAGMLVLAALTAIAAPALARAADDPPLPEPVRIKPVAERAKRPMGLLDLGTYGRPGAVTAGSLLEAPRFESSIDVEGQAPRDLNATMAIWWEHFDLPTPSPYGAANSSGYRPGSKATPGVNVLPVLGWLKDKIKDRKNKD